MNARITITLLLVLPLLVKAQPKDNAFRSMYNPQIAHWTDSLKWATTYDVTSYGATANDSLDDDLSAFNQAIDAAHQAGGGVVYVPSGRYHLSDDLMLKSGVLIRGDNPAIDSAKTDGYLPPSQLFFPKYVFDTTANNGAGVDNSTAFKIIWADTSKATSNFGLVNLWVNRATIVFHPNWVSKPGFAKRQPSHELSNAIVMGCLSTNAALPDPGVPNSKQRPWQRYCYRFTANIDMNVARNGVIVNNRLNDTTVARDNFNQPNYVAQDRKTKKWEKLSDLPNYDSNLSAGYQARFDYTEHYAISLNRFKKWRQTDGTWKIDGHKFFPDATEEPDLYAPGNLIADNYAYYTMRVGIYAAGTGLKMLRNTTRMNPQHDDVQTRLVAPTGKKTPQGATTLENRGLDASGFGVEIAYNDYKVYRDKVDGYLSTDGEGILTQECCGGTQINGYHIHHNVGNTYIGLYKMRDIFNTEIDHNQICATIQAEANTNNQDYHLYNVRIHHNDAGKILALGHAGGTNALVDSNTVAACASGSNKIVHSCYVELKGNSSGYTGEIDNNGGVPCLPKADLPTVAILSPSKDTVVSASSSSIDIKAKFTNFTDTADVYANWVVNNKVISNPNIDWNDSTTSLTADFATYGNIFGVSMIMVDSGALNAATGNPGVIGYSKTIMVEKPYTDTVSIDTTSTQRLTQELPYRIYPNPARENFSIDHQDFSQVTGLHLINMKGQTVATYDAEQVQANYFSVANYDPGLYLIWLVTNKAVYFDRLVIE